MLKNFEKVPTKQNLELAIRRLVGVKEVLVITDDDIKEIHILIEKDFKPQKMVVDLKTLLFVQFNYKLSESVLILMAQN